MKNQLRTCWMKLSNQLIATNPAHLIQLLQWTMQRVQPTVINTLGLTNMIGGYYWPMTMGKPIECTCPRARIHDKKCVWYNPNYINIPDTRNALSTSEQAAQEKIYDMYQSTQNGQQELCGCGTVAEIAYLGHKSTCEEFQWIHERSSYEMLLVILHPHIHYLVYF